MKEYINYIMHIPKTAGLSLQMLARRRYKKPGALELVYTQEQVENGFEDRPGLLTVMGHFRYGHHRYSERPARYFTFLRNPLDHIVSHYRYTQDHPEKFKDLPKGIENILDFARCPYGYNLQTRFVAGIDEMQGRENEVLERARYNLKNHFEMVGITEEFDLSLLMLAKALGWRISFYVKKNTGHARKAYPDLSAGEKAELNSILKYDIQLYEYGLQLFEEQKIKMPELTRGLKAFQQKNRWFQRLDPFYVKLKKVLGLTGD